MKVYYVYIMASGENGTLYIGMTSNLIKRVWEHKNEIIEGFTSKYRVDKLMYFEQYDQVHIAISREKRLKKWPRRWKLALIDEHNSQWLDLYPNLS